MEFTNVIIPWPEWKIVERIGRGSFGTVYKIQRDHYGEMEESALKVLSIPNESAEVEDLYADGYDEESIRNTYQEDLKDIEKEYRLLRQMKGHPNIVSLEDYCEVERKNDIGWNIYIRMELLTPLQNYLKDKAMSEDEIVKLGKDICQALIACEKRSIIHRDIKPHNILISDFGVFKLGDFGVAKNMDHTTHATKVGTEVFMAPEVSEGLYGKEVDIYSLGLVLYWLLNRRRMPFLPINRPATSKEKNQAYYRRIQGEQLPSPADGSEALKNIVLKACAFRKEDRYRSAGEMLDELEALAFRGTGAAEAGGEVIMTVPPGIQPSDREPLSPESPESPPDITDIRDNQEIEGNEWGDTQGTIGKKPETGDPAKEDDMPTAGTGGKKKKPEKKDNKKTTNPSEDWHTLNLSCLEIVDGCRKFITRHDHQVAIDILPEYRPGCISILVDDIKIYFDSAPEQYGLVPVKINEGYMPGSLAVSYGEDENFYITVKTGEEGDKGDASLPPWLLSKSIPKRPVGNLIPGIPLVIIGAALFWASCLAANFFGWVLGIGFFGFGVYKVSSAITDLDFSIRKSEKEGQVKCVLPDKKNSIKAKDDAIWLIAVNGQWVYCTDKSKDVHVPACKGDKILLACTSASDYKKQVKWCGEGTVTF